ncbi:transcriptional regulator/sugar kinase [Sphaerochaeta pleomorpha str. Grapes]|uniref:Transcriptional regulator/sugar kinase n=1 Tax=Sphaerochaeta pleomorpha (strain ATCC BAA-1885 / DSM 22778 / Grapes) TaxID=158190 RepID=G8QXI1_SPHPG|nr:ROK family protein [Sphaerochaeta pleomorpha]AEV29544.1 transcriptional regulator/sugar kinase [Sphaerochaeta pleomorpha str. Grapes]
MYANKGKNLEDIQAINRYLVIKHLLDGKISSRIELAQKCNLNQATITNIINDFIGWGLVEETGSISKGVGRPVKGIRLCNEKYWTISVRLSRKYVKIAIIDFNGKIESIDSFDIKSKTEMCITIEAIISHIRNVVEKNPEKKFVGIGIAMPGPWMKQQQKLAYFTGFYKWQDIDIGKTIEEALKMTVFVEQDANAALMAEPEFQQWTLTNQLILLVMVGQGIGAGIFTDGEILRGNLGIAGEIGHMSIDYKGIPCECGNVGCLERYASTSAVLEKIQLKANEFNTVLHENSTWAEVIEAYKINDTLAVEEINNSANYIGFALSSLSNVLNPAVIIIGDEMAESGQKFLDAIKNSFNKRVTSIVRDNTKIQLSNVSDNPFLRGISRVVIEGCIKNPIILMK